MKLCRNVGRAFGRTFKSVSGRVSGRFFGRVFGRDSKGFSLIEIVFCLLILSILMLAATSGLTQLSTGLANARNSSDKALVQQSGAYLKDLFVAASPTYHFLHFPVPALSCVPDKPCIRRFDPASARFVPNESTPIDGLLTSILSARFPRDVTQIQFFRDYNGSLADDRIPSLEDDGNSTTTVFSRLRYSKPLDLSSLYADTSATSLYTTFPMVNARSPGFPLLTQKQDFVILSHFAPAGTSTPPGYRIAFFESSSRTFDPNAFKNSLAVVFNVAEPSQYGVQYIREVIKCTDALQRCQTFMRDMNDSMASGDLSKLVAVELLSLRDAPAPIPAQMASLFPRLPEYNSSALSGSNWPGQSPATQSLFPTERFPIYETPNDFVDLLPPIDVRRIQHYFTTRRNPSQLVLLPISMRIFKLEGRSMEGPTGVSAGGRPQLDLVSHVIGENKSFIQMDQIIDNPDSPTFKPPGQILYFARRLGSTTLDIIVEQK